MTPERSRVPRARPSLRLLLVQTSVGDYRQSVLDVLASNLGNAFVVCAGAEYFDPSLKTRITLDGNLRSAQNHFLLGRRLLWQSGCWREIACAEVALLELNPRILSTWVSLVLRKLLRKRTVLWGHAWPRAGREARTESVRAVMRRLADAILVYTETQATELRRLMPSAEIFAAPNALYRETDIEAVDRSAATGFLYVGRLVPEKKPGLLLDAFRLAQPRLTDSTRVTFVGDGPLRAELEDRAADLGAAVEFTGHVGGREELRRLHAGALVTVSPGYVGLSITQSFSFGLPMLIARDEPHAPEIEAAVPGVNCLFFDSNSPASLADALLRVQAERARWVAAAPGIAADCAQRYSVEKMAARILEATVSRG